MSRQPHGGSPLAKVRETVPPQETPPGLRRAAEEAVRAWRTPIEEWHRPGTDTFDRFIAWMSPRMDALEAALRAGAEPPELSANLRAMSETEWAAFKAQIEALRGIDATRAGAEPSGLSQTIGRLAGIDPAMVDEDEAALRLGKRAGRKLAPALPDLRDAMCFIDRHEHPDGAPFECRDRAYRIREAMIARHEYRAGAEPDRLDALRELSEAVTWQGPLRAVPRGLMATLMDDVDGNIMWPHNAAFIVAAVNYVRERLSSLEAPQEERQP